jgi:hypothetical protein
MPIKEQAALIRALVEKFSVSGIYMDKKGNGVGVMDELVDPDLMKYPGSIPIVDVEFDENQQTIARTRPCLPILHMLNPTVELNTSTAIRIRAAFQKKTLLLPKPFPIQGDKELERVHLDLQALRGQLIKIKTKVAGQGLKFFVPERKSADESLERGYKDLFSGLLYAFHGLILETTQEDAPVTGNLASLRTMVPFTVRRRTRVH